MICFFTSYLLGNPDKSAILLAQGQHDVVEEGIPEDVEIKCDGTIVVGAAVGTDDFVKSHLDRIVRSNAANLDALSSVDP